MERETRSVSKRRAENAKIFDFLLYTCYIKKYITAKNDRKTQMILSDQERSAAGARSVQKTDRIYTVREPAALQLPYTDK